MAEINQLCAMSGLQEVLNACILESSQELILQNLCSELLCAVLQRIAHNHQLPPQHLVQVAGHTLLHPALIALIIAHYT